jgi:hypothetical protein
VRHANGVHGPSRGDFPLKWINESFLLPFWQPDVLLAHMNRANGCIGNFVSAHPLASRLASAIVTLSSLLAIATAMVLLATSMVALPLFIALIALGGAVTTLGIIAVVIVHKNAAAMETQSVENMVQNKNDEQPNAAMGNVEICTVNALNDGDNDWEKDSSAMDMKAFDLPEASGPHKEFLTRLRSICLEPPKDLCFDGWQNFAPAFAVIYTHTIIAIHLGDIIAKNEARVFNFLRDCWAYARGMCQSNAGPAGGEVLTTILANTAGYFDTCSDAATIGLQQGEVQLMLYKISKNAGVKEILLVVARNAYYDIIGQVFAAHKLGGREGSELYLFVCLLLAKLINMKIENTSSVLHHPYFALAHVNEDAERAINLPSGDHFADYSDDGLLKIFAEQLSERTLTGDQLYCLRRILRGVCREMTPDKVRAHILSVEAYCDAILGQNWTQHTTIGDVMDAVSAYHKDAAKILAPHRNERLDKFIEGSNDEKAVKLFTPPVLRNIMAQLAKKKINAAKPNDLPTLLHAKSPIYKWC